MTKNPDKPKTQVTKNSAIQTGRGERRKDQAKPRMLKKRKENGNQNDRSLMETAKTVEKEAGELKWERHKNPI